MREVEYSEAAVEVLDILNYTNQEDVRKIPQSFIKFLTEIANKNYKANFNHNGPISGLNLRKQTRELLGFIYINSLKYSSLAKYHLEIFSLPRMYSKASRIWGAGA